MLDEAVTKESPRSGRALQPLRRLPEGARELKCVWELMLVAVPFDGRGWLDAVLNPPESRGDRCGEREGSRLPSESRWPVNIFAPNSMLFARPIAFFFFSFSNSFSRFF